MSGTTHAFDVTRPHRLSHDVALRPEAFGALAYHYGNRRLVFLKSRRLVEVVRSLEHHASADAAIDAAVGSGDTPTAERARGSLRAALSSLVASEVICEL